MEDKLPFVSMSLWRYSGNAAKWWAFRQMGLAPSRFKKVEALRFSRLMGSGGGNGFSLRPNWGVYAFLGVWDEAAAAHDFFDKHPWAKSAEERSVEQINFWLRPVAAHGSWGGQSPFGLSKKENYFQADLPVAVLTRATIRSRKLLEFWRYAPQASAAAYDQTDRLLSIGVGEYPVFMQATFSLWSSGKAMENFAYKSAQHKEVVELTRARKWYREELFARFQLIGQQGRWEKLQSPPKLI